MMMMMMMRYFTGTLFYTHIHLRLAQLMQGERPFLITGGNYEEEGVSSSSK